MTVQTTYSTEHAALYAGMVRHFQPNNIVTGHNAHTAVLEYGKGVVISGSEDGVAPPTPTSTAADFVGVVMYELGRVQRDAGIPPATEAGIPVNQDGSVAAQGQVAVVAIDAVSRKDNVFLRVGATSTGDFTNAAGSGDTLSVQIPNAQWKTDVAAGEIGFITLGAIGG